jgi:hypothetical protein
MSARDEAALRSPAALYDHCTARPQSAQRPRWSIARMPAIRSTGWTFCDAEVLAKAVPHQLSLAMRAATRIPAERRHRQ